MATIEESSDKTKEQVGQGAEQLYVYKQGLITISPSEFIGTSAIKSTEVNAIPGSVTESNILFSHFDVYQKVVDYGAFIQGDAETIKLNYNFGTQKANARWWYKYWAGSPGYIGINIDIYYTADAASGSLYSADQTQEFYYTIYTKSQI